MNDSLRDWPSSDRWPAMIEGLNDAVWLVDAQTLRVVAANRCAVVLLGDEALVGRLASELLHTPEDVDFWQRASGEPDALATIQGPSLCSEAVFTRADDDTRYLMRRISCLTGDEGQALYMVAASDITESRRSEQERETLIAELQATLESSLDGILVVDLQGKIRTFNRSFARIWGLKSDLLYRGNDAAVFEWMNAAVVDGPAYEQRLIEIEQALLQEACDQFTLRSGQVIERVVHPQWSRNRVIGRVFSFRDLSAQVAANRRIQELSTTDTLTGLPNRARLAALMREAVSQAARNGTSFALLILDLDRFKQVNDGMGPVMGDQVLIDVAQRLRRSVRNVDVVARVGGDQFAILAPGADQRGAEITAQRVLDAVGRSFDLQGAQFTLTCSVGVAVYPTDGQEGDELVRHAETAMQNAKQGGRASYRFHRAVDDDVDHKGRLRMDHAMRQALVAGDFRLHYQPQLDLITGDVVGAEALLRWHDPLLGNVSPGEFIPVAEESGFIVPIGDWVLGEAVRQAAVWQRAGLSMPVAVNVSAVQFQQVAFIERVAEALQAHHLPPALLELELTESILVHDAKEALARLQALANLGIRLSIDDFGTGYSSLAYLKRFPIGKLKIDRSFVRGLPSDDSDAGIVRAIIQMSRALGLKVIAEGVESETQHNFLRAAGCHEMQGFLFSPAVEPGRFEQRARDPVRQTWRASGGLPGLA